MKYKIEEVIIAHTVGELLQRLEAVPDETVIDSGEGLALSISNFEVKTETFTDAFDHTVYQHDIYEPISEDGELCLMLCKKEEAPSGYELVFTIGKLKKYIEEEIPLECKAVSVDDNFELKGAITESVKLLRIRRDGVAMLKFG